jgi:hypothetical protein
MIGVGANTASLHDLPCGEAPFGQEPRMEQRKFQRFSDNSHVLFSSDTVKSFGVEFIRIAPGSQQRLQDYLAALEGAASDAA